MFRKLLRRDLDHRQLRELYRRNEEGVLIEEPEAALRDVFEADRKVIAHLTRLASVVTEPEQPASAQRAQLLQLVAQKGSQTREEKTPMIRQLRAKCGIRLGRTFALAGVALLLAGGALTASAATGGVSDVAGNVHDVLAALHVTDRTPDEADTHDAIDQPAGGSSNGLDNANEHANDNAQHGLDTAAEGSDNAGDGIQNASDQGLDHANDNALDGPNNTEQHTPAANLPDQANDNASQGADNATHEANDNASEGADNATEEADNGDVQLPDQANDNALQGNGNAHVPDAVPDSVGLPHP